MPQGEIETHPYLQQGKVIGAKKLILGSFPIYECTNDDNIIKQNKRKSEGTVRFFYGSNRSRLWTKYNSYIDILERPWNVDEIIESLEKKQIAISDLIKSCERYKSVLDRRTNTRILQPFSSADTALHNRAWNKDIIEEILKDGVVKILCTSKGVLNDLEKHIICDSRKPFGSINSVLSIGFQKEFVEQLGGNNNQIVNPIAKVFTIDNRNIFAIAIPSPGSPQRKIFEFGCVDQNKMEYAEKYFSTAFKWLKQ